MDNRIIDTRKSNLGQKYLVVWDEVIQLRNGRRLRRYKSDITFGNSSAHAAEQIKRDIHDGGRIVEVMHMRAIELNDDWFNEDYKRTAT